MLVGFKRQFAPFVLDGSKRHTIRAPRADGKLPTVGETLHCYVDPRQKTMALLGRWPCVKVEAVGIAPFQTDKLSVVIGLSLLTDDEASLFLWRDGFRTWMGQDIQEGNQMALTAARHFWRDRLKTGLTWHGNLLHWNFGK